jgi:hypothetical protein
MAYFVALVFIREVAIDVPEHQSIQKQTKAYPVHCFQGAESYLFKVSIDWIAFLLREFLSGIWTLLEKCHLPDSVCST